MQPLIKKQTLDCEEFSNYRPITNIAFLSKTIGSLRWDDGYARERQAEVKHKNTGLTSVFTHPLSLGGNCKTALVSSLLFLYFPVGNSVCQLFARFISKIPFLYYAVHFLASFCQKFPNRMWIQWTDWATAVCSWSWCSRQRRSYRVRALVKIETGAKNEVLDPVYPLSCLPSWSRPLSYRKLPHRTRRGSTNSELSHQK